jgi:very-short-patch-repair endonuclease
MGIFICKICKKECEGINSLRSHSIQKHNVTSEEIYLNYILNGVKPKCECGCGETTNFISVGKGYSKFIQSHHNRVPGKNNYHKDPKTHQKAIDTQKKNWKDGKYVGWWENKTTNTLIKIEGIKEKLRNNKERGDKISKKLKGIPKSEESKIKNSISQKKRYNDNPKLREDASNRRVTWLKSKLSNKKTKLETKFELLLNLIGIEFEFQFEFKKRLFDFKIKHKNILIEVDGDFYHCNPDTKHSEVLYETQKLTKKNDLFKNELCKNHDMILLRYWEKDINERPEWVISELKKELYLQNL